MRKRNAKTHKVLYYVGWGVAWGSIVEVILGLCFGGQYLRAIFWISILGCAAIGLIYGLLRQKLFDR